MSRQAPTQTVNPFKSVRRAAVPIVAIETSDPAATIVQCLKSLNGSADKVPVLRWDVSRGLTAENKPGTEYIDAIKLKEAETGTPILIQLTNPAEALSYVINTPPVSQDEDKKGGIVFMCNAHLCMTQNNEPNLSVIQAIWNLRDTFKTFGATLCLLCPSLKIPSELSQDVVTITEEAPTAAEIESKIVSLATDADLDPAKIDKPKTVDALLGYLSLFAVEQSASIAMMQTGRPTAPDIAKLWELKVANLKQCASLDVSIPRDGFEQMSGNDGVKQLIRRHINGREKPRAILWLEEIEKALAGGTTDLSGTTQAVLEQFLYWTQSKKVKGFLLAGVPGAGKSLTCQATAGEANCPLLRASLSTVKGSLVGQSEANMKAMLKSIDAVAQGRVLMLATCNSLDTLSPEVMARFNLGTIWYDYPTAEEAAAIWDYYIKKFSLKDAPPKKHNWVGREIESCCERAWLWNIPLAEAAETVVPVCTANAGKIEAIRQSVSGRFLSAAQPGIFKISGTTPASLTTRRLGA